MRIALLFLFALTLFAIIANAQSGRRGLPPPPPPPVEKLSEPPIETRRVEREAVARPPLTNLPEDLLSHELLALDETRFSLGDFSGKVIVVNIWASWCGPCRR